MPRGSTWFTALVLGVLSEAERIINDLKSRGLIMVSMDPLPALLKAFDFLLTVQRADGCFVEHDIASRSKLHASFAPDENERTSDLTLTSHVLTAFTDMVNFQRMANSSAYESSVSSAVICLLTTFDSLDASRLPTSVLALLGFALSRSPTGLTGVGQDRVQGLFAELRRRAFQQNSSEDRLRWWPDDTSANSAEFRDPAHAVEATAYALLTLSANQTSAENLAVLRWLSHQQNEHGGFHTTQGTIVAVRALVHAAIGLPRFQEPPAQTLVSATLCPSDSAPLCNSTEVIPVNGLNAYCTRKYLNDRLDASDLLHSVVWELTSPQPKDYYCASVRLTTFYHTLEPTNESLFSLEVENNQGRDTKQECTHTRVKIVIRLSEMAIKQASPLTMGVILLSVQLPTGWETNLTASTSLISQQPPSAPLQVDLDAANRTVLAYFQAFTETESEDSGGRSKLLRCLTLDLQQTMFVEPLAPSTILVQEYFAPHRRTRRTFTPNSCKEYWAQPHLLRLAKDETHLDLTAEGCPRCAVMPRESLIRAIEESLCLYKGTLLLFSPDSPVGPQAESIVGTAYEVAFGETIAVWNTTLKLNNQCRCETLGMAAFVMLSTSSPHRPVVGATEMSLAGFDIVKVSDVEQALKANVGRFLPEAVRKKCARMRGLQTLLRKCAADLIIV
ncbi:unnamed protein product [Schistocephalus solidus]|uniref:TED_complement domain-containing protein n=1 Tax=Schistocephalus solidus TaxID=70667 RepID=A0A183SUV5_SCHSO|nr:unnamed protein product [Schistocephalus solidus]